MIQAWIRALYQFLDNLGFSHPIHAVLVHLPIGFVVGAFILGSISFLLGRDKLALSARHCTILATIFWFPAVLFGFTDWAHYYGLVWSSAIKIKLILAGILFILLLATLYFENIHKKTSKWSILTLYTSCLITVTFIGWYGAQIVYGTNPRLTLIPYKSGYRVFINECNSCHPDGGNVMDEKKPINNSPKLKNINTFISFVRQPEGNMPSFPASTIPDHETEELYLYLTTVMNR
jgi:uncharacterized membrane protein